MLLHDLDAPDVARLTGLLERLVAIDTQNPPGREAEVAALLAAGALPQSAAAVW